MFSRKAKLILESMRCRPEEYYQQIYDKFGTQVQYFNDLTELFGNRVLVSDEEFIEFCRNRNISNSTYVKLSLDELFKNLNLFREENVFQVFKYRETACLAPRIYLLQEDVPSKDDLDVLPEIVEIYRGCQKSEFDNKKFTQSWTICKDTAFDFAKNTYSDIPEGVVVKALVNKKDIIYYDFEDDEQEVVLDLNAKFEPILVDDFD